MILAIAKDALEAQELMAIIGAVTVCGGTIEQRPSVIVHKVGDSFANHFRGVWVRQETMAAITSDPVKWEWWNSVVLPHLPAFARPTYI